MPAEGTYTSYTLIEGHVHGFNVLADLKVEYMLTSQLMLYTIYIRMLAIYRYLYGSNTLLYFFDGMFLMH